MILDCLWFFVAILPGVVALAVDFTTGCIYESSTSLNLKTGDAFLFRIRAAAPANANLAVTLDD